MTKVLAATVYQAVTPTISTSAYVSGDRLGSLMEITGMTGSKAVSLLSVAVVDKSGQSAPIDLVFFGTQPTIASADNDPFDLTDANMDYFQGKVSIQATDYIASTSNSGASVPGIGLALKPIGQTGEIKKVYCQAVIKGSATYATTSALVFKFYFSLDDD